MLLANGMTVAPQSLAEFAPQITASYYYPTPLGWNLRRSSPCMGSCIRSSRGFARWWTSVRMRLRAAGERVGHRRGHPPHGRCVRSMRG
jgi:hypothetical protein